MQNTEEAFSWALPSVPPAALRGGQPENSTTNKDPISLLKTPVFIAGALGGMGSKQGEQLLGAAEEKGPQEPVPSHWLYV